MRIRGKNIFFGEEKEGRIRDITVDEKYSKKSLEYTLKKKREDDLVMRYENAHCVCT